MFIAKNNDLIVLANESREQLEQDLKFIVYTEIVETQENYILYNGEYKTEAELLPLLKNDKYQENDDKANAHLLKSFTVEVTEDNVPCVFIYNDKTERNLNSAGLMLMSGLIESKKWTDEQGVTVYLKQEDIAKIGAVFTPFADAVWVKWGDYKAQIDEAKTVEEVEAIIIEKY